MFSFLESSASLLASAARAGSGAYVGTLGPRPQLPLIVYEMEPCPFSRKVREALSRLDLPAEIRPCPRGSVTHRSELRSIRGSEQIPYLIDLNTDRQIGDSSKIVQYLYRTYGDGKVPLGLRLGPITDYSSKLASVIRFFRGNEARSASSPEMMLELWTHEASTAGRLIREWLSAHEVRYLYRPVAFGSPHREKLRARAGNAGEPMLHDPNYGRDLTGSEAILDHLEQRYSFRPLPRRPRLRFLPGGQEG